jgi:spore coat protein A, manganese oxidase
MKSRIPQPKTKADSAKAEDKDNDLSKLRWKTKLERPELICLDDGTSKESPRDIYIGRNPNHVFFEDVSGDIPSIVGSIWGYGTEPEKITSPGVTLEATEDRSVFIKWKNILPRDTDSKLVHHPFVEPPRELRSPGMGGRYDDGHAVVHLHGAHVPWTSDGYSMRVSTGMNGGQAPALKTILRPEESETFEYPNTQPGGATLWYHDHTMDRTAMNVYAGLAGVYLLRHQDEKDKESLPKGNYEIPLVIQDRSFTEDGRLLYGDADFLQQYIDDRATASNPQSFLRQAFFAGKDPQPSPEFKGQAICVNGKIWPYLEVEPRPYRFRIVNGSNSRMYVLRLSKPTPDKLEEPDVDGSPALPIYQIGADGGLLAGAIKLKGELDDKKQPTLAHFLLLAPGERADVIIDFATCQAGETIYLSNHAKEQAPFGNGGDDPTKTYPYTNGIIKFIVNQSLKDSAAPLKDAALQQLNDDLKSIAIMPDLNLQIPPAVTRRYLIEEFGPVPLVAGGRTGWKAITFQPDIQVAPNLVPGYLWGGIAPTFGAVPNGNPRPLTEAPPNNLAHTLGQVELWEFYNNSPDVHPIHLHHSSVQIVSRSVLADPIGDTIPRNFGDGVSENERGFKDTVRVNPGELIQLLVRFADRRDYELANRPDDYYKGHFVWHCHILEHEDMGMMRPLEIE